MRNVLCLVIGIIIGASAATGLGQQRDIVSLNHIAIAASDFDAASAFYTEVMGLRPIENTIYSPDEWLKLDGNGFLMPTKRNQAPPDLRHFRN